VSNVNPEEAQPKEVGVETPADSSLILTPREREQFYKFTANPMDVAPEWKSYWEQFVRDMILTEATSVAAVLSAVFPTGDYRIVPLDLTAETSLYVHSDATGDWLYCNGASISGQGYDALEAIIGATLPDARGRPVWFTGTHADADLLDNDGVAVASRTPAQTDTISITVGTSVSLTGATITGSPGTTTNTFDRDSPDTAAVVTVTAGTLDVGGTGTLSDPSDTDTANITVPHVFIGSLLIRP
jgi:hypothetical protein